MTDQKVQSKTGAKIVGGVVFAIVLIWLAWTMLFPTKVVGSSARASLDEFNRIQTGMSYAEVCKIIGGEGTELSRTDVAGTSMVIYAWDGNSVAGANMNATFQNGRLMSKAQMGLK
jgi:hypothetical protein